MTSLLVTNDFPPKVGGIQSYLWELWRRLPPRETTVLTTAHPGAGSWDARQPFRVERTHGRVLLPTRALVDRIDGLAREVGADVVFLDPWLPLGAVAPRVSAAPVVLVVHGAEVTVPGHVPPARALGRRVLRASAGVVAAGRYVAGQLARVADGRLVGVVIPPGVDVDVFGPRGAADRLATRHAFGLATDAPLVLGVSRLVPRKGFDVLIAAVARLPGVELAIVGGGRDRPRLERHVRRRGVGDRVQFLGQVASSDLPSLYATADVFAMPCRDRFRGLEAEGFGIVFAEAAACGVPAVAGRSGGSHEAVTDGVTGFVVDGRTRAVDDALRALVGDPGLRRRMGDAARARVVADLAYDRLVEHLRPVAAGDLGGLVRLG